MTCCILAVCVRHHVGKYSHIWNGSIMNAGDVTDHPAYNNTIRPPDSFFFYGDRTMILFALCRMMKERRAFSRSLVRRPLRIFTFSPRVFPRATTRERVHDCVVRDKASDKGARGMILRESSLSSEPGRARFWICHSLYWKDERENGVVGIQKEMGQSDAAEVATREEEGGGEGRGRVEEGKEQPAQRDVRMYDVSLLRKLDFSRLHARTTTGANRKQQKTVLSTDPGTPVMRD